LQGEPVEPYLPILKRMLHSHHTGRDIRTGVECKGQRRGGEVFLAHVWLSTYPTSSGPGLAAVVWDASENLRDREGSGLDSMMATSRVLIGAMSHEIRNLASAASAAHASLRANGTSLHENDQYHVLGTLIQGLEKIASSGLRVASDREAVVADLGTVLDETRIVIEPALREAGVSVVWELSGGLPLVQADHHGLLQVFVNLARNSQRAMEGCGHGEIRISAALESDLVVVRFRDTGPGVAHPEELFRPFQTGADSAGIGLYISRAILRSHGGGLRYEPQDAGSCFAVELWPVENSVEG
jgi:signal transduction histidine kinase